MTNLPTDKRSDPAFLFELRVRPYRREYDPRVIVIRAYDGNHTDPDTGHMRILVSVRNGGKVVFPLGQLYCAVNRWTSIDGIKARELVMSLVGMKPGDTDEDYFAGYSHDQLAWAEAHGEAISCEREARYCDPETGAVRNS
jgi:hypothetical protein